MVAAALAAAGVAVGGLLRGNGGENLVSLTETTKPTDFFPVPTKRPDGELDGNDQPHWNGAGERAEHAERAAGRSGRSLSAVASVSRSPEETAAARFEEDAKAAGAGYFAPRPGGFGGLGDDGGGAYRGAGAARRRVVAGGDLRAWGGDGGAVVDVVDAEFGDVDSPPPEDEYRDRNSFFYRDPDGGFARHEQGQPYEYSNDNRATSGRARNIIPPTLPFERRFLALDKTGGGADGADDGDDGKKKGEGVCSPLEVVGIDGCPELEGVALTKMLGAKRDMLRQVVEVLTDPASSGDGGHPDEPLLLVQKLAVDETDAIFGAFETRFARHTTDAGGWNPQPGGFNRWVERYHRQVLKETRPVLITVHVSLIFVSVVGGGGSAGGGGGTRTVWCNTRTVFMMTTTTLV